MTSLVFLSVIVIQEDPRFFGDRGVDFWGTRKQVSRRKDSLWTEPILGPDGRWQVYTPPREVVDFLESPNRETGERYLAWQRERMSRLRTAVEVLKEIQTEPPSSVLYYFSKPGCPYCVEQDRVLAAAELSRVPLIRVEPNSPLWTRYAVRVTPTLVLHRPGNAPRVMEGWVSRSALEREVHRVDR